MGLLDQVLCGGNELSHNLDKINDNWDKVSLNFTPHTPMAYHKKRECHIVFIEIKPEVAAFNGVYFTNCNATRTRNGHRREQGLQGLKNVRFDMINGIPRPSDKEWVKYVQAEVLVPNSISLNMINAIHHISIVSKQFGEQLFTKHNLLLINKKTFSDIDYSNKWTIEYAHPQKCIISNIPVNKDNVDKINDSDYYIRKGNPFWVIVHLYAIAGTRARIELNPEGQTEETIFVSTNNWSWWPKFTAPNIGNIELNLFVNDIIWLKKKLEVQR
jgi:hypothetical protein